MTLNKINLLLGMSLISFPALANQELTVPTAAGAVTSALTIRCTETDRKMTHSDSFDYHEFSLEAGTLKTLQSNIHDGVQYIVAFPGDGELGSRRSDTSGTPPVASEHGTVTSIKVETKVDAQDHPEAKLSAGDHHVTLNTHEVKDETTEQENQASPTEPARPTAQTDHDAPSAEPSKLDAIEHPSERAAQAAQTSTIHTPNTTVIVTVVLPNGSHHADVTKLDNNSMVNSSIKYRADSHFAGLSSALPMPYKTRMNCQISRQQVEQK